MRPRTLLFVASVAAGLALAMTPLGAQEPQRIEIVEVSGIIDGSVERTLLATIEQAERSDAALVIAQIDSRGVVDAERTQRIIDRVRAARVPIVTWIGPPGARAEHGAAMVALAGHVRAMAPATVMGPVRTLDLRSPGSQPTDVNRTLRELATASPEAVERGIDAGAALDAQVIDTRVPALADLLDAVDETTAEVGGRRLEIVADPDVATVRFHKLDLFGRVLHGAAQPSITYLLLLLGLVGIVFELFHPSTGPAGIAGMAGLALGLYGIVTLGGSWLGFALIVVGVAAFAVDLRFQSLGPLTVLGLGALIAGSLLLFQGPWLRVSSWVLAIGIIGMFLFLVGAMTRVLRDLRAVARGELEVRDAHPHPDGEGRPEVGRSGVSTDERKGRE